MRVKSGVDQESSILDPKSLENVKFISDKFEMDFLVRFWELMQKYINEINNCFDEKQFFEITIMRLCYVSMIPTPFELLKEKKSKKEEESIRDNESSDNSVNPSGRNIPMLKDHEIKVSKNNLAIDHKEKKLLDEQKQSGDLNMSDLERFKSIVDKIEMNSELQISYHLRNSFKLVSLIDNKIVDNPIRHQNSHRLFDIRSSHGSKMPIRLARRGVKIYKSNMFCGWMKR